jgi:hypothetical protein
MENIKEFYLQYSKITEIKVFVDYILNNLPDEPCEIAKITKKQINHFLFSNRNEEKIFRTSNEVISELLLRDERGFVIDRNDEDKIVGNCFTVATLFASILKGKCIPCRVRNGFMNYFPGNNGKFGDHFIVEYWNQNKKCWIMVDPDRCLDNLEFDPFNLESDKILFPSEAWLKLRNNSLNCDNFLNNDPKAFGATLNSP